MPHTPNQMPDQMPDQHPHPTLIVPTGTQVVIRVPNNGMERSKTEYPMSIPGAVGVIIRSPTDQSHTYAIRLPSGETITLHRHEFTIRKHFQQEGLQSALTDLNLTDFVIYRCIVGSRAFGLEDANSDTDRRGIYLPPANLHWSIYGIPEQIEQKEAQECYWELQKFMILALKANPNVLECLYTPLIETATPLAEALLQQRSLFLSQLVYQTYNGYILSQFKKMEQDLRTRSEIRWKHAMHLIRLLLSGITILQEGFVPVRVDADRERLLAIKRQERSWDEVNRWRLDLHEQFDRAFTQTALPERPDYAQANAFLIQARRTMVV